MKPKSRCCRKYEKKSDACKRCPLMWGLGKKTRRKRVKRLRSGTRKKRKAA